MYSSSRYVFEPGSSVFKFCKATGFQLEACWNDEVFLILFQVVGCLVQA